VRRHWFSLLDYSWNADFETHKTILKKIAEQVLKTD
jgi:hypothetical protein